MPRRKRSCCNTQTSFVIDVVQCAEAFGSPDSLRIITSLTRSTSAQLSKPIGAILQPLLHGFVTSNVAILKCAREVGCVPIGHLLAASITQELFATCC
jgi:hypothetical protein